MIGRRILVIAAGLWTGLALATPAASAPAPSPAPLRVTVTADAMDVDTTARLVVATGGVRITDGTTVATAEKAVLHHRDGRGVLVGKARVRGPQGVLDAGEITFFYTVKAITRIIARGNASLETQTGLLTGTTITILPPRDSVVAEEKVTFFSEPDVVATGQRLTYDRARGAAVLEGSARLQNAEGFIHAARIEGVDRLTRATATGGVTARYRDIAVRSEVAEYDGKAKRAVFIGAVEVVQTGRHLFTEKVTVWYAAGRILAEGQTRVRIDPTP